LSMYLRAVLLLFIGGRSVIRVIDFIVAVFAIWFP